MMKEGGLIEVFNAEKSGKKLKIIFRYPARTDAEELLSFVASLVKEGVMIDINRTPTEEEEKEYVSKVMDEMAKRMAVHVVAECNSQIVAKADVRRKSRWRSSHVGVVGISVRRGFRDIGVGKKLLQILQSEAKDMNIELLFLEVFARNDRAISLYKSFGFAEVGRVPDFVKDSRKYDDVLFMVKKI